MSKPWSVGQVDLDQRAGRALGANARAISPGRVAVVADARARGRARRPRSRGRGGCPTRASESLPPDTATSTRSPGASMSKSLMALRHLVAAELEEVLRAEVGVVAPDVDDRRPLAHGALHAAPPEMTGRISTTSASSSSGVAGHERVADDHEHRLAVQVEALEERVDPHGSVDLELPLRVAEQHLHDGLRSAARRRGVRDERATRPAAAPRAATTASCGRPPLVLAQQERRERHRGPDAAGPRALAPRGPAARGWLSSIRCGGPRRPSCASCPCAARGGRRRRSRRRRPRRPR